MEIYQFSIQSESKLFTRSPFCRSWVNRDNQPELTTNFPKVSGNFLTRHSEIPLPYNKKLLRRIGTVCARCIRRVGQEGSPYLVLENPSLPYLRNRIGIYIKPSCRIHNNGATSIANS